MVKWRSRSEASLQFSYALDRRLANALRSFALSHSIGAKTRRGATAACAPPTPTRLAVVSVDPRGNARRRRYGALRFIDLAQASLFAHAWTRAHSNSRIRFTNLGDAARTARDRRQCPARFAP